MTIKLILQPQDGIAPVVDLLRGATRTVELKQFTFDHPLLLAEIIALHQRGVRVRVMLNEAKNTGERINDGCYGQLNDVGIEVCWSSPSFLVTHEKTVIVDGERALIATFNFMEKYFSSTRDYGVIVDDAAQVQELRDCFDADWARKAFVPKEGSGLGWSPGGGRKFMCDVIDASEKSLDIQHPKFAEVAIFERIAAALKRGVKVRILCGAKRGLHQPDLMYSFALWRVVRDLGGKVHKQKKLSSHGKLILVDEHTAILGSQNLDQPAFDSRREVSVILQDRHVLRALRSTYDHDWEHSKKFDIHHPLIGTVSPQDALTITHL